ncbi:MAG: hypothetical protein NDI61_05755 [Bdellovibrionaceae bacterium]|nr:hypothetical protein [Pseudobdellovibrionaceae bacterium]
MTWSKILELNKIVGVQEAVEAGSKAAMASEMEAKDALKKAADEKKGAAPAAGKAMAPGAKAAPAAAAAAKRPARGDAEAEH